MDPTTLTVLLVEDEALIGMAESRTLNREGYAVIQAYSGEEALEIVNAKDRAIDLILMDINLGEGMDGTEAAKEILKHHDIPIVFLSSHTDIFTLQKIERIAAYGFVVKNLGSTMLFATIKMAFRLHRAHRQIEMRERRFRNLIDNVHEAVSQTDENDEFIYANSAAEAVFGVGPGQLAGKPLSMFIKSESMGRLAGFAYKTKTFDDEFIQDIVGADGVERKLKLRLIPEFDERHRLTGTIAVLRGTSDIEEGASAGDTNDAEQSLLLRELEHRVKNSLNIIMSLLSLDAQRLTDEASKQVIVMAQTRIRSISLLYDQLSRSSSYDRVNSVDYIGDLVRLLGETYTGSDREVHMRELVDDFELDSKFCLPLGLILNELLSNAFKYAFPSGRSGTVTVELRLVGSEALLRVKDDGVGLPRGHEWSTSQGFGLQLVKDLVGQLHGTMEVENKAGLTITLRALLGKEVMSSGSLEGKGHSHQRRPTSSDGTAFRTYEERSETSTCAENRD
jgi:PAS domain S-box-containing protein